MPMTALLVGVFLMVACAVSNSMSGSPASWAPSRGSPWRTILRGPAGGGATTATTGGPGGGAAPTPTLTSTPFGPFTPTSTAAPPQPKVAIEAAKATEARRGSAAFFIAFSCASPRKRLTPGDTPGRRGDLAGAPYE